MRTAFAPARLLTIVTVFMLLLPALFFRSDSALTKNKENASLSPNLSATKTGALDTTAGGDVNGNGLVNPGDRLNYSITVSNTGTDASNVIIQDILNSNLILDTNSINSSPIAVNDSFNALGNVAINVPAASGVKINDFDPDGTTPSISGYGNSLANANSVAPGTASTTAQGGNVTLQADGSFSYNPPAGFEGMGASADSFFYTVSDGAATNTAQVSLNVSGMIWFINNNPGACSSNCNGRLSNPFTTVAAFQAINNGTGNNPAINDHIFIYESGAAYTGGITLLNQQKLIGQDTTNSLMSITGITPPQFSNSLPATNTGNAAAIVTIQNSYAAGSAITLNNTGAAGVNVIRGLTASNSTVASILGNNFGTVLIDEVIISTNGQALNLTTGTISGTGISSVNSTGGTSNISLTTINGSLALGTGAISGATNAAFFVSGGNVGLTYSGNISKTNATAGALVSIASHTTGNITLSGSLNCSSGCTGIAVNSNTSGTIEFSNATKNINTGANAAVNLTNNTGATINFTNGGLNIDTTSGAGVTATGGGTINVSGGSNTVDSTAGKALDIDAVSLNMTLVSLSSTGAAEGVGLTNLAAGASFTVGTTGINNRIGTGIFIDNVPGTVSFGATTISNTVNTGSGHGIRIEDSSAAVTFASANISNSNQSTAQTDANSDGFPDNDADGDAIFLKNNTGSFTLNGPSTLLNNEGDGIDIRTAQNLSLNNVTINGVGAFVGTTGNSGGIGGHGIFAWNLMGTNTITNSTIMNWEGTATNALRWWLQGSGSTTMTIKGTTFKDSGDNQANPTASGAILYRGDGTTTSTLTVGGAAAGEGCTFTNIYGEAIGHAAGNNDGSTARADLNVIKNSFTSAVNGGQNSISARNGASGRGIVVITGNTFDGVGNTLADTSGVIDIGADATDAGAVASGAFIHFTITDNIIKNIGIPSACVVGSPLNCDGKRAIDVFIDDNSIIGNDTNPTPDADDAIVISNNVITNTRRTGIYFDSGSVYNGSNYTAKITNNCVGKGKTNPGDATCTGVDSPVGIGTALSTGGENGIRIENRNWNAKNLNILVNNNFVRNGNGGSGSSLNGSGILLRAQNTATISATVTNNNVSVNNSSAPYGLRADTNFHSTNPPVTANLQVLCLDASGNTLTAPAGGIALLEQEGTLNVEQSQSVLGTGNGNVSVSILGGTPQFSISGGCAAPPAIAPLVEENISKIVDNSNSYLSFLKVSDQPPLDMLATLEPFDKPSTDVKTIIPLAEVIAHTERTVETVNTVVETESIDSLAKISTFFSKVLGKLGEAISPTVTAKESVKKQTQNLAKNKTETTATAPEAGETVCVDGNTNINDCTGGFTLPAGESTTITFRVTLNSNSIAMTIPNTANVTAAGGINQNSNNVDTVIVQPPTISKAFGASSISFGSTTTLTFTVGNPNPSTDLTNISFTDTLPDGLVVANPNGLVNNCGGGTVSAISDSNSIVVSALSRNAATANCTIVVNVQATSLGEKNNLTGSITSTQSNAGGTATASLAVTPPVISGTVTYGVNPSNQATRFVSGVAVAATGASTPSDTTDSMGIYSLENLTPNGGYTVVPSKTGDVNGISPFDATLILRHVAANGIGPNALTGNQLIAADTNGTDGITPFDATLILRFIASGGQNANTGEVGNWKFNPNQLTYASVTNSLANENYQAVLVGDVNGSWIAP
jgi:uncharacterized repeat protein (TIGR01451 family)